MALAAYAASGISGLDPMRTGVTSFRLGIAAYIVPFMFFCVPEILLQGPMHETILRGLTALVGIYALAGGVQGWYFGKLGLPLRGVLIAGALFLFSPSIWFDLLGLGIMALVFVLQRTRGKELDHSIEQSSKTLFKM